MSDEHSEGPLGFGEQDSEPLLPEPPADRPPPPIPSTNRYTWFVGGIALIVLIYIAINTLSSTGPGSRGVHAGQLVPPFAAPLATGPLDGDVNVATPKTAGNPHQAGRAPACTIHTIRVLTVCATYVDRPLLLAFFASRGGGCVSELDRIATVSAQYPGVDVAAVAIRGNHGDIRKLVLKHGWEFPVAYDHDGVLANLYGVAVCPQITYVRRGGRVAGTSFGSLGTSGLAARFAALANRQPLPPNK